MQQPISHRQSNIQDGALQLCIGRDVVLPEYMIYQTLVYILQGFAAFWCSAHLTYYEHT